MAEPLFQILAAEATPLGELTLRRRALLSRPGTVVTEVTLDGEHLMSSYITASECALARVGVGWHGGAALRVCVGGLGLGYTAHAALASDRVAAVDVVELLPAVIGWLERGLIPLADALNADARLRVVAGDVYARLALPATDPYDLVLIDVDHAPDAPLDQASAAFYTVAGLQAVRAHLRDGGILGVWSAAANPAFVAALERVFADVRIESVAIDNDLVDEQYADALFFARR